MPRTNTVALSAAAALLAVSAAASIAVAADKPGGLQLAPGAHVGVLNLLDPEVTQFHAARHVQDSFLKTYSVNWPLSAVLAEAVRERLTQLGLAPVTIAATEALRRAREGCLLNAALAKGLPKGCGPVFAQLAEAEHVEALLVFGPGLNNSTHAGGNRRRDLPEYLRGWCFVSEEDAAAPPTLLNLTELLLIGVSGTNALISARQWGGDARQSWSGFKAPADLKEMSQTQLAELQPLFAAMLKLQAGILLNQLQVTR